MLNYLRSDLWRLRRSGIGAGVPCFLAGFFLLVIFIGWLSCMSSGSPRELWTVGSSFVDMAANFGFSAGFLPLTSAYGVTALIATDFKSHGFKKILVGRGSRGSYLAAKVAVAALYSLLLPGLMLLCLAVFPVPFGLSYDCAPHALEVLQWWGVASVVCFGYSTLCVLIDVAVGNETAAWTCTMFLGLGLAGMAVSSLIGSEAVLCPQLAPLLQHMIDGLLRAQGQAAGMGMALLADGALMLRALAVSAGWAVAASALAYLLYRRRTL